MFIKEYEINKLYILLIENKKCNNNYKHELLFSIRYIDIAILSNIIYRATRKTTIIIDIVALLIDI